MKIVEKWHRFGAFEANMAHIWHTVLTYIHSYHTVKMYLERLIYSKDAYTEMFAD